MPYPDQDWVQWKFHEANKTKRETQINLEQELNRKRLLQRIYHKRDSTNFLQETHF
jgi:hypothetical protein